MAPQFAEQLRQRFVVAVAERASDEHVDGQPDSGALPSIQQSAPGVIERRQNVGMLAAWYCAAALLTPTGAQHRKQIAPKSFIAARKGCGLVEDAIPVAFHLGSRQSVVASFKESFWL